MNPQQATTALNYVAVTSALTKRALDEVQVHRTSQEKAASLRPTVLQQLIDAGCVGQHQKEAAEAMLGSHAETLQLLKSAATKIAEQQKQISKTASDLGRGIDHKEAGLGKSAAAEGSYNSLTDGYVGRKTSEKKASDEAILRVLSDPR